MNADMIAALGDAEQSHPHVVFDENAHAVCPLCEEARSLVVWFQVPTRCSVVIDALEDVEWGSDQESGDPHPDEEIRCRDCDQGVAIEVGETHLDAMERWGQLVAAERAAGTVA